MFTSIFWIVVVMSISTLIGAITGLNRKRFKKQAVGTLTFLLLTTTVTGAMIAVRIMDHTGDTWRYAAALIQGVGFIGAGVVFKKNESEDVKGITTAVMLFADVIIATVLGLSIDFTLIPYSQSTEIPLDLRVLFVVMWTVAISVVAFAARSYVAKKSGVPPIKTTTIQK